MRRARASQLVLAAGSSATSTWPAGARSARPVLVFPTAGGDAEEIERFHLVDACGDLIDGRAGQAVLRRQRQRAGAPGRRGRRRSTRRGSSGSSSSSSATRWCRRSAPTAETDDIEVVAAGSSIGAFNALDLRVPVPRRVPAAVCMSGTYDLRRFFSAPVGEDFSASSPLNLCPRSDGPHARPAARSGSSCWPAARGPTRTSASRGPSPTCSGPGHPQPRRPVGPAVAPRLAALACDAPATSTT